MGHFEAGALVAALDVEAFVRFGAVEDGLLGGSLVGGKGEEGGEGRNRGGPDLVAADLLGHVVESLDDAEAQLLALLVLEHGDVFDVADQPEVVDAACRASCQHYLLRSPQHPRAPVSHLDRLIAEPPSPASTKDLNKPHQALTTSAPQPTPPSPPPAPPRRTHTAGNTRPRARSSNRTARSTLSPSPAPQS